MNRKVFIIGMIICLIGIFAEFFLNGWKETVQYTCYAAAGFLVGWIIGKVPR